MSLRTLKLPTFAWWLVLLLSVVSTGFATEAAAQSTPMVCDVDRDLDVDRKDLSLIAAARGQNATGPDDPRDPDRDRKITVNDGRICALRCTLTGCAEPPPSGNRPPLANAGADQTVFTGMTVTLDGTASSDPDGNPLTFRWQFLVRPPGSTATVSSTTAARPTFVADAPGRYEVQLVVNDGTVDSSPDVVVVNTEDMNSDPVANAGPDQTNAFVGIPVILDGSGSSDVNADTLSFAWAFVSRPAGSTATLQDAGTVGPRFTPDLRGEFVVRLTVRDGRGGTGTDDVRVSTENTDRPPVANAGPDQSVLPGQLVSLNGSGSSDPDRDPITAYSWSFTTRPTGSTAVLTGANTATPSFTSDRRGDFVLQLIVTANGVVSSPDTVVVTTENVRPVANAGPDQNAVRGDTVTLDGNGSSDANGDALGFLWSFMSRPAGSGATLSGASTPIAAFVADVVGPFVLQLIVNDGLLDSAPDSAIVTVNAPENRPPVAANDTATTPEETSVLINVLGNDTDEDGDTLTLTSVSQPANGTAAIEGGQVRFTPVANFNGQTSFTYGISDGNGGASSATVTVTVSPVNDDPVANPDSASTARDTPVDINVTGNDTDVDGNPLTVTTAGPAANGTVTVVNASTVRYTPNAGYTGPDAFSYTISDGNGGTATANVSITVSATNRPPVANDDAATTDEDTAVTVPVLANDSDPDNDTLSVTAVTQPASGGTVAISGGGSAVQFTPSANFNGQATFTYTASDGEFTDTATVTVTVSPVNDDPVANPDSASTARDTPVDINVTGNDTDVDGNPLTVTTAGPAANGTVTVVNASTVRYTPNAGYTGPDAFSYTISDGNGGTATANVSITVSATNRPPVANDDGSATEANTAVTIDVLANDTDPDNDPLTVSAVTQPAAGGTAAIGAGGANVVFTPAAGFTGPATFTYTASDGRGGTDTATVTVTISALPTISIADLSIAEGNAGQTAAVLTVTLSRTSAQTVTVNFATADGTATAGSDYAAATGTLSFAPGVTSQNVTVQVNSDTLFENAETVLVNLSAANNATVLDPQGVITITNDDTAPTLSIGDVNLAEGNAGPTAFVFTVTQSAVSGLSTTVDFATANGTATSPSDYGAVTGSVTIPAGSTTGTATVTVAGDSIVEPDETFFVNLSNAVNATIADGQGIGTIVNDDGTVVINLGDAVTGESGSASITATLSASSSQPISVQFATANGTATAGADYTTSTGTVNFAPGSTTQNILIPILADTLDEDDETFSVTLANPTNASIGDGTGVVTITDDDVPPALSINDVSVGEGNAGTVNAVFTVSLSAASSRAISAGFATSNGSAVAGADFVGNSGTLNIPAGQSSGTVTVVVNGDTLVEGNETFVVTLANPVNATIADGSGTGTIIDDDLPSASIGDVSVLEGNAGNTVATLTITLSVASTQTVNVGYATADGSAVAPGDYQSATGVAVFAPGATTQTVNINVVGDTTIEANETFSVNLVPGTTTGATINDGTGIVTIQDDDFTPTVTIAATDATATEGGTNSATFTFTRSGGDISQPLNVFYNPVGTAANGLDYPALSGVVIIPANQASTTIVIDPANDALVEGAETVVLTIVPFADYVVGTPGSATATIQDDDFTPTVTIVATDATANEAGGNTATFTVTRTGGGGSDVAALNVIYDPSGTATNGGDYASLSSLVTIPANQASATIVVDPANDAQVEGDETVILTLRADPGYNLGTPASAQATIVDDDLRPTLTIVATDATANEAGGNTATFTVTRTGGGGSDAGALNVFYGFGGTAANGTDYAGLSGVVTIPADQASATIVIDPVNDALVEGDETVILTLLADPGYNLGTPASAQATIVDDDLRPTLTIVATDATANEAGGNTATFTVTRTGGGGSDAGALNVFYGFGGTAANGTDYAGLSGVVTIPADQASATIVVDPANDALVEGAETVVLTITPTADYVVGTPGSATATIQDDDFTPTVTIVATDATANEAGGNTATFTVTRTGGGGSDAGALNVFYGFGGTAANGTDYAGLSGVVTIPADQASATIVVDPANDALVEGAETVVLTITPTADYVVGTPGSATATIQDDDFTPTVTIVATDATANEAGGNTATFTVTRTGGGGSDAGALNVFYGFGGTAANGTDYAGLSGVVTIPADQASATIVVDPANDALVEGDETVILTLLADPGYNLGTPASATVTIIDDDTAGVLSLTGGGNRPALSTFTLGVSSSTTAGPGGIVVDLSSSDASIASLPATATIPQGGNATTVTVTVGSTIGTATLSATAAGFTTGATAVNSQPRVVNVVPANTFVGVGRSIAGTLNLPVAAPAGGVTFTLASADLAVVTVAPTTVNVLAGATSATFTVTGVAPGGTQITASAPGYTTGTANVSATNQLINIGTVPVVGPGQSASLPVSLSSAAVGDVVVTLTSADPAISTVTPTVTIADGQQLPVVNPQITGVALGVTTVTAAAAGFAPETRNVTVALSLAFQATPATIQILAGGTGLVALTLSAPAPAGGFNVNLSSDATAVATVPPTITFPQGQTLVQVLVTAAGAGTTTIRASAPGVAEASKPIQVNALGTIEFNETTVTVGDELQAPINVRLPVAPPAAVAVTVSVPAGSGVLLSSSPTAVGTETLVIPAVNDTNFRPVYVQGTAVTAAPVNISASAPGYAPDTIPMSVTPSGFAFSNVTNPVTVGAFAVNQNYAVRSIRLNADGSNAGVQDVRGGASVPVTVTNSNTATGVITNSPVTFTGGVDLINAVFDPLAAGSTNLAVVQPAGFTATTTNTNSIRTQFTVNVTASSIAFNEVTVAVGNELQATINVRLVDLPTAPADLTLSVPAGSGVLLSSSPTAAGTETLVIPGVNNTNFSQVYVQGTAVGGTTITASAPGYADDTLPVTVTPSGFAFSNVTNPVTVGAFAVNQNYAVRSIRLNADGSNAGVQDVRGGASVPVTVTNSNTATGVITNSPVTFTGGVDLINAVFDPLAAGSTNLAVVQPAGFTATTTNTNSIRTQFTVNVTASSVAFNETTIAVGNELQATINVRLVDLPTAPADLTLSVPAGSGVLLSSSPTAAGTETLVIPGVNNTNFRQVYVQGTAVGGTTITASAPGYADGTLPVTVTPSGFAFSSVTSPVTVGTFAVNQNYQVRSIRLNADGSFAGVQDVRGGASVPVTVTNSNTAAGVITNSPVTFTGAVSLINAVFDPLAQGSTVIGITQPAGYTATTTATTTARTQFTVNVIASAVEFGATALSVGDELQEIVSVRLVAAPPSPVDLTLSVPAGSGVLLSSVETGLGTETLVIPAVNNTTFRTVYVQSTTTGATTLRAFAPGYSDATIPLTLTPAGFVLQSFTDPQTNNGVPASFTVRPARLNNDLTYAVAQDVRGSTTIPVTITSSNPAAGTITNSPLTFIATTPTQQAGFLPVGAGATVIAVVQPPGFAATTTASFTARVQGTVNVTSGLPTVAITASDSIATEAGTTTGTFTVTRTGGDLTSALLVPFTRTGTATLNTDYTGGGTSVSIPANQTSATITVTPVNDALVEGDETVILTLAANANYVIGVPNTATVTIVEDDFAPTVTITASDPTATEAGPTTGTFTVTRAGGGGSDLAALTVSFTRTGTAILNTDYTGVGTSVSIPANQTSATITVTPFVDTAAEGDETVILSLAASANYVIGTPSTATVTIVDFAPTVTITATDPVATEAGPTTGTFTVTRAGGNLAVPLSVTLTRTGTATNISDYTNFSLLVTIPASQTSATVTVTPVNDALVEGDETVILTLAASATYFVGAPDTATVTITSDE